MRVTLCAALIKFDRFEWIVEKATELGVDRILPVETARSEKGLFEASRKRTERWVRIARESSQQSRRVRVPEILPAVRLRRRLAVPPITATSSMKPKAPPILASLPAHRNPPADWRLSFGPEGGWTDAERQAAAPPAGSPVSLGNANSSCGNSRGRRARGTDHALVHVISMWRRHSYS